MMLIRHYFDDRSVELQKGVEAVAANRRGWYLQWSTEMLAVLLLVLPPELPLLYHHYTRRRSHILACSSINQKGSLLMIRHVCVQSQRIVKVAYIALSSQSLTLHNS